MDSENAKHTTNLSGKSVKTQSDGFGRASKEAGCFYQGVVKIVLQINWWQFILWESDLGFEEHKMHQ